MTNQPVHSPQFFLTAPSPCPYLDGQFERKVFTHLVGEKASELNDLLTQGGFRRSQNIAYRPACETCRACVSVRIIAEEFEANRSMKRIVARNRDIIAQEFPAEPSSEQYSLFRGYLDARHNEGGMSDMTVLDYAMMVEDTHVPTKIIEYRLRDPDTDGEEGSATKLIAVALSDVMGDGLSMVYSYFDPDYANRSLGTYMILDHIQRAKDRSLPHVYLGYWVAGSRKMGYKTRFLPQDHLMASGWERYEG
ncbi:MAG: arginyltransferase [Pseudomonadota bacterium]